MSNFKVYVGKAGHSHLSPRPPSGWPLSSSGLLFFSTFSVSLWSCPNTCYYVKNAVLKWYIQASQPTTKSSYDSSFSLRNFTASTFYVSVNSLSVTHGIIWCTLHHCNCFLLWALSHSPREGPHSWTNPPVSLSLHQSNWIIRQF